MSNSDLVILYSGGADSYLMLSWALQLGKKPHCVFVDYQQKHIKELSYAVNQLEKRKVPYQIVRLYGLNLNSGLTGDLKESRWENVNPVNVPGRNSIFISIAYSIAENLGIDEVWLGADYSDYEHKFPDCYQEYIGKMNNVLQTAGVKPIKLRAPLLGWTKEMVVEYLQKEFGVDMKTIYSGYEEPKQIKEPKCTCNYGSCEVDEKNCPITKGEFV